MKKLLFLFCTLLLVLSTRAQKTTDAFEVSVSGKGDRAILFIPGFACSGDVWKETRQHLESAYTCYTLTMAGFAGAPAQSEPSFKQWEDGIAAYIRQHKITKPVIVGHSMGGGLAMALAADYPELVGKVVVVDALPCLAALQNPAFKAKENNDCSAMVSQFAAIPDDQFRQMQQAMMPRLLADTPRLAEVVNWSVRSDRATFARMYCDFSNTDLREKIAHIKCPALILLEPSFAAIKPAIEDQYKQLRTASLQYATKGLHFIMYDDPAWYQAQLDAFLN